ncbi:hypothetical protein PIB30_017820 [Stylosanthes scabra]|uniref:Uncharacterized protein n=1 Tax=Stylosanthes scabra TaxID=79078 RepID=A0ABU6VAW3_9FABA|nr:hypothetical protein [Stylosanthes scabra]
MLKIALSYVACTHGRPNLLWKVEFRQEGMIFKWTKNVKSSLNDASGFIRDAIVISRQSALMEFFKQLAVVAAKDQGKFKETRDVMMELYSSYKAADEGNERPQSDVAKTSNPYARQTDTGQSSRAK